MNIFDTGKNLGYRPPPPPLPKYNPKDEAPKWDVTRVFNSLPVDKGPTPWPRVGGVPESSKDPDWRGVIRDNVIALPPPEPYTFGAYESRKYNWFDTPDYADPIKKMADALKWFTQTGLMLCCSCGFYHQLTPNIPNSFKLLKRYFVPYVLAGMLGSASVIVLANLRGRVDDKKNYAVGGLVFSSIVGRKQHRDFFQSIVLFIPAAIGLKYASENNMIILPKFNQRAANYGIGGMPGDRGFWSGDLRLGLEHNYGDPGRDVRTPYA